MKDELLAFIDEYREEFMTSLSEWSYDYCQMDYPTEKDIKDRYKEIHTTIENL